MSRRKSTFGFLNRESTKELTVHVNMAPMIDFLVITIAFLLMSASYVSVGMIESLASSSGASEAQAAEPVETRTLEVVIRSNHEIKARIVEANESHELTFGEGLRALKLRIADEKFTSITLNAEPGINYGEIVHLLSELRSYAPQVSLNVDTH